MMAYAHATPDLFLKLKKKHMRRLTLLTLLSILIIHVHAQDRAFKTFKVDIALGFAMPTDGAGVKAGALVSIQPHYRVTDNIALGLRFEGAGIGYVYNDINGNQQVDVKAVSSYCLSGEFYFNKNRFRPFVGVGAGLFDSQAASSVNNGGGNLNLSSRVSSFGGYPEIGFEAGHFRLCADYNFTGNNLSYFSLKIGAFFGGGRNR
jgi:Outer membrane protein beta-barrel domain